VLLAGIGLYSVLPLSVSQRRREIAVRLALGASPRGVLPLTVREGMTLVAIGRRCGWSDIGDAAAEGDVVRDECLRSADVAIVPAVLGIVALAASYLPARRAAAVDPIVALRD